MGMVNVYDDYRNVVARVKYNQNLDYFDGSNFSNGGLGRHKGLTKLKNGSYILIHGTDWQGERDYAIIVSPEHALQEILKSNNEYLLEEERFSELRELYTKLECEV